MSLSNTTKFANRLGLDIKFYAYNGSGTLDESATPLLEVDFANEVSLEASGDNAWATGGQKHGKQNAPRFKPIDVPKEHHHIDGKGNQKHTDNGV